MFRVFGLRVLGMGLGFRVWGLGCRAYPYHNLHMLGLEYFLQ